VGHYGGHGTMAATIAHCVFAICKHGCCLLSANLLIPTLRGVVS
jgi:hypothetical protein